MVRDRPAHRRPSVNLPVHFTTAPGKELTFVITLGLNGGDHIAEVFCTDFKSGSDHQALITDACILFSRLLQHGDTPAELAASMCGPPPSMIGAIAQAIVREDAADVQ